MLAVLMLLLILRFMSLLSSSTYTYSCPSPYVNLARKRTA